MRHITSLTEAKLSLPSVITIGAYDGVHRGHQYLVSKLVTSARAAGHVPVVLTFYPHPEIVLRGSQLGFYLTLPDEKARLLANLGVELVVTHPFDDEVRQIRASEFVDRLLEHLNMRALWVGEDFAMGYQREGDVDFLRAQGREKGFQVEVVDLMDAGDERVSSSRVRVALAAGDVAEAARLLGRPHFVTGEVIAGARRGRTLGFPTANLSVPPELAMPARGVYVGWVPIGKRPQPAVINIGLRPTFDGTSAVIVEAHLIDFSGDLYGQRIEVHFVARLRDEQKFAGVEALVAQIRRDVQRGREVLAAQAREAGTS